MRRILFFFVPLTKGRERRTEMPKKTGRLETVVMPVEEAAERLGMSAPYLRARLQEGQLGEIGFAVKSEASGRWSYFLYRQLVEKFLARGGGDADAT